MSEVTSGEQQLESLSLTHDLRSSTQRQAPRDPARSNITAGTVSSAGHPPPTPASQGPRQHLSWTAPGWGAPPEGVAGRGEQVWGQGRP